MIPAKRQTYARNNKPRSEQRRNLGLMAIICKYSACPSRQRASQPSRWRFPSDYRPTIPSRKRKSPRQATRPRHRSYTPKGSCSARGGIAQRAAERKRLSNLHRTAAHGIDAHQRRTVRIAQRSRENLGGTAVLPFTRTTTGASVAHCPETCLVVWASTVSIFDHDAALHEQRSHVDRLVQIATGIIAQSSTNDWSPLRRELFIAWRTSEWRSA